MPTIRFNSSTGSNTTASGSAGTIVANGTNASFSGSVVTLDGSPDLSGFNAANDILWLDTSTGRQFFDLSSADNSAKTLTTVNAPSGTSSGLTWGVGGKRATLGNADSLTLITSTGAKAGWEVVFEDDQTNTGVITFACSGSNSSGGRIIFRSDSTTKRKLQHSISGNQNAIYTISGDYLEFRDLHFEVIGTASCINGLVQKTVGSQHLFRRCNFSENTTGTCPSGYYCDTNTTVAESIFIECYITGMSSHGINHTDTGLEVVHGPYIEGCRITNCGGAGIFLGRGVAVIRNNVIAGCTGNGISLKRHAIVCNNVIHDCGGDGIESTAATGTFADNILSDITTYGIQLTTGAFVGFANRNAFYAIGSAAVNGLSAGPNDITLSADPFVDAASGDFNINDTAGGGALLRAATATIP